jgi:hypothetical protein
MTGRLDRYQATTSVVPLSFYIFPEPESRWGRPPACGGLSGRPALDHSYCSGLAARQAATGLFSMYHCTRRDSSPLRTR